MNDKSRNPLSIPGSSVTVSVISESGAQSSLYGLKMILKPVFPVLRACRLAAFRQDLEKLRSEYSVGSMTHDAALIKYLDQVAISKSLNKDKLLRCQWSDISPSEDQLSIMPVLKELIDMAIPSITYRSVLIPHTVLEPVELSGIFMESPSSLVDSMSKDESFDLTSTALRTECTIKFQLPMTVDMKCKIFWLNTDGVKVVFHELQGAGAEYERSTFVGHVWIVSSGQNELGRYIAGPNLNIVRVPFSSIIDDDSSSTVRLAKCSEGHSMALVTEMPDHYDADSELFCNSCGTAGINDHVYFFNCRICSFDLCANCVDESCLPKPRCTFRHRMIKVSDYCYPVTDVNPNPPPPACDGCKTLDLPNEYPYFYHCEPCMYDLCPACSVSASPIGVDVTVTDENVMPCSSVSPVISRLKLLQMLNNSIESSLPFIDLSGASKPGTIAYLLSSCRSIIISSIKSTIWDRAIDETQTYTGEPFKLQLSHFLSAKYSKSGKADDDALHTCFSQAFRQIHNMPPRILRRNSQIYETVLEGENPVADGGSYRKTFEIYCQELQSKELSLLIPTPNMFLNIGYGRDNWILNPGAASLLHREMFVFLGKLFGIAIRGKHHLPIKLPSIVWKLLVGETPSRGDIQGIDTFQVTSLDNLRQIDKDGIDSSTFNDLFFETFTVVSLDNRVKELVPGGSDIPVLFENRLEYCDLIMAYRLREIQEPVGAVLEGLSSIIPSSLLTFTSWEELERLVCGKIFNALTII